MQSHDHLKSLRELGGYEVSREDPDVRGWNVVGGDGQRMGTVKDLIIDTDRMKVEYLEIDGPGNSSGATRVPVSSAQLDTQHREVLIAGGTASTLSGAAQSTSGRSENMRASGADTYSDRDRSTLRRAEEELRIGKREVQAGEVVVGKHVETERVTEPVSVTRERVHVERRPVTDAMSAHGDIGPDEIRVPVVEEELIVEKRPVVKEELVISKERVQETETVEADLRREEFDVRGTPDGVIDDGGEMASRKRRR
jgi:uncharacterized protein (TIGR02271 family)